MAADITKINPELEALFRKYESAPDSYVFAPLADAYRKAGMHDEAVAICRKGVSRHPDYPSGHVVQGKCYFDIGDLDLAEEAFKSVLNLDASNLVALKFLGMIQVGRGDLVGASEFFHNILVLDPANREIRGMLEDLRELDKSIAQPADVSKDEPPVADNQPEPDAVSLGDGGGADESWKDDADDGSFEGSPIELGADDGMSDELATTTLADIYAAQGYYDKAGRIYREVLRRHPDNAVIRKKLEALESDGEPGEESPSVSTEKPAEQAASKPIELPADPDLDDVDMDAEKMQPESVVEDHSAIDLDEPERSPEPVSVSNAPAQPKRTAARKAKREPEMDKSSESKLDNKKSYDQFKRWLDNMQK
jgi:tetratricopeptide (TPR) repeat protein